MYGGSFDASGVPRCEIVRSDRPDCPKYLSILDLHTQKLFIFPQDVLDIVSIIEYNDIHEEKRKPLLL